MALKPKSLKLFDCFIVVRLVQNGEETGKPYISYNFPEKTKDKGLLQTITNFCFPDRELFPRNHIKKKDKVYTFVLTNGDGQKRFGYCFRELEGGIKSAKRWPVCYCILTFCPCFSMFQQILRSVSEFKREDMLPKFLGWLSKQTMPSPGSVITFALYEYSFMFKRDENNESSSLFSSVNFESLLDALDGWTIMALFTFLLAERRVIFISSNLRVLSNCVQAIVALLHPFVWQHVFIPVLPPSMLSFVCAPVPFVVGVLDIHREEMKDMPMEEVVIVDVDKNEMYPVGGDYELIPPNLLDNLLMHIQMTLQSFKEYQKKVKEVTDHSEGKSFDLKPLSHGLLSFLDYLLIGYENYFDSQGRFNREEFIEASPPSIQAFKRLFVMSQMFERFTVEPSTAKAIVDKIKAKPLKNSKPVDEKDLILKEGALTKLSGKNKQKGWQVRWFVLYGTRLSYFKTKSFGSTEPSGEILLSEISQIRIVNHREKQNCFEIKTPERTFLIYSDSKTKTESWEFVIKLRTDIVKKKLEGNGSWQPQKLPPRTQSKGSLLSRQRSEKHITVPSALPIPARQPPPMKNSMERASDYHPDVFRSARSCHYSGKFSPISGDLSALSKRAVSEKFVLRSDAMREIPELLPSSHTNNKRNTVVLGRSPLNTSGQSTRPLPRPTRGDVPKDVNG